MPSFDVGQVLAGRYEIVTVLQSPAAGLHRVLAQALDAAPGTPEAAQRWLDVYELRDAALADSFERDMSAAAAVVHVGLVPLQEVLRLDAQHVALVRESQRGATLADALQLGALAAGDTMRMMARLAGALAAAHEAGIAHGGLHPSLIALPYYEPPGPRHLDDVAMTGLAEPLWLDLLALEHAVPSSRLDLMYRAPEQLSAAPSLGFAADVYAWGIVCLHALVGRHPLRVGSVPTTTVEIIARQAGLEVASVLSSTPLAPTLRRILERALDVDPDTRYRDASRLALDLQAVGLLENTPRRPLGFDARPRVPSIAPSAIALGGLHPAAGPERPRAAMSSAASLAIVPSLVKHFDDVVTLDGSDDLLQDELLDLEPAPEPARLEPPPPAEDVIARMSRSRTTVSGILLRPSELNLLDAEPVLHPSAPSRDATPASPAAVVALGGGSKLALGGRLAAQAERLFEVDDRLASQDHIPTVDLSEDALGKALSALDRLPPEELEPDDPATLTPAFTYGDDGEPDLTAPVAPASEPAASEAPAAEPDAPPAPPAPIGRPVASKPAPSAPSPEPSPPPRLAELTPDPGDDAELSEITPDPSVEIEPRRSRAGLLLAALILIAVAGAAYYFLVLQPSKQAAPDAAASPADRSEPGSRATPSDPGSGSTGSASSTPGREALAVDPARDGTAAEPAGSAEPCTGPEAAEGCLQEALALSSGPAYDRNEPRAAELLEQACSRGPSDVACAVLAARLRDGRPAPTDDLVRAFALVEPVCTARSNPAACRETAVLLADGLGTAPDEPRAVVLLEAACAAADTEACVALAGLVAAGRGIEADVSRAVRLFETACEAGQGAGCFELALRHRSGDGVRRSNTRYRELLERGCAAGHAQSCKEVADQFRSGKAGRNKDLEHATQLYQTACGAGFAPACTRLCYMERNGEGMSAPNPSMALVNCGYGCDLGDPDGCSDAINIIRFGKLGLPDAAEQLANLRRKLCALDASQCADK